MRRNKWSFAFGHTPKTTLFSSEVGKLKAGGSLDAATHVFPQQPKKLGCLSPVHRKPLSNNNRQLERERGLLKLIIMNRSKNHET